jgi:putative transposase
MLAYITGTVDQELLLRNEYLPAENRILRAQVKGRLRLSEAEKGTLPEIAHRLGRKALEEVAATAKPDTVLGWYRRVILTKANPCTAPLLCTSAECLRLWESETPLGIGHIV